MGVLLWIVFGIVAGSVATRVMPGPDYLGLVGTALLSAAGAVMGGLLGAATGSGGVIAFDFRSFLMAVIGSLVVLICYRSFSVRAMA